MLVQLPKYKAAVVGGADCLAMYRGGDVIWRGVSANPWDRLDAILRPGSTKLEILWPDFRFWFQDVLGTVPVTTIGQSVRTWRSVSGTLFTQPTNVSFAPVVAALPNGNLALLYDGVNDWLQSAAPIDFSASDGLTNIIGVRVGPRFGNLAILCLGTSFGVAGGFVLEKNIANNTTLRYLGRGNRTNIAGDNADITNLGGAAVTLVGTTQQSLQSGQPATIRRNGVLVGSSANTSFGAGNFAGGYRLNIGAYLSGTPGTASSFFDGMTGPIAFRGGALMSALVLAQAEAIPNAYMGV